MLLLLADVRLIADYIHRCTFWWVTSHIQRDFGHWYLTLLQSLWSCWVVRRFRYVLMTTWPDRGQISKSLILYVFLFGLHICISTSALSVASSTQKLSHSKIPGRLWYHTRSLISYQIQWSQWDFVSCYVIVGWKSRCRGTYLSVL
jgi:hypothetical protein